MPGIAGREGFFSRNRIKDNRFKGSQKRGRSGPFLLWQLQRYYFLRNLKSFPRYLAVSPSISSMRSSWLYLAILSDRQAEPVLICPVFRATARSAIAVSSVSPERWLITAVYELR